MQPSDFTKLSPGKLVKVPAGYWAFAPGPLPPKLDASWALASQLLDAERALAELAGTARTLPNPHLLIGPFARREAVLSSKIEGTQASLSDLVYFEAAGAERPPQGEPLAADVREVWNYVRALEYGLSRLKDFPLSLRLIRELHGHLMQGVRGAHLTPGEFRRSQNWIGSARSTINTATYVPPPVPEMTEALGDLETFLHADSHLPPLIRFALVHYQFEAIHPFLDGNGRIGRLLLSLLLCHDALLPQPLLYLSAYFEKNRQDYYRLLLAVSQQGAWLEWIEYFLRGVADQSRDALWRTGRLLDLRQEYRGLMQKARTSALPLRLVDSLFENPALTIPAAAKQLGVTQRAAWLNIQKLMGVGIVTEVTGRERFKVFVARGILDLMDAERTTSAA